MKKIPTLFKREFEGHKIVGVLDELTDPSFQDVLDGKCLMTVKFDGSCCCVLGGYLYKRFDAKKGKKIPEGAIPCCEPDPITGHHPHWVAVNANNPGDKWFIEAAKVRAWTRVADDGRIETNLPCATYEAVGKHFNGNPYALDTDTLITHGCLAINWDGKLSIDVIRNLLTIDLVEGYVFWRDNEPICKIKRSDFGIKWPIPEVMNGKVIGPIMVVHEEDNQ